MTAVPNSWEGVSAHAKRVGAKFPELVAAQWALESSFGKHFSGTWNAFGLKGKGTSAATKEFYDGEWVEIKAGFIDFPSLASSIEYLVTRWYRDWRQYKGANHAPHRNAAAKMLQNEGYATDPSYAAKLVRIMDQYAPPTSMAPIIRLTNAAKYFNGESHQLAAWNWLEKELTKEQLEEFAEMYRAAPAAKPSNPLQVPYFSQRDNASGKGYRECFSSSCAMLAAFYGKVAGDDEYNLIRQRYGDSTDARAQVKTLQHLGLSPLFRQNMSLPELQAEINTGRPVAVGWLHKGSYTNPSGGGHWSVAVGYTSTSTIMHDPYGACDLAKGAYPSGQGGKFAHYANKFWLPRWFVKSQNDGWAVLIRP